MLEDTKEKLKKVRRKASEKLKTKAGKMLVGLTAVGTLSGIGYAVFGSTEESEPQKDKLENLVPTSQNDKNTSHITLGDAAPSTQGQTYDNGAKESMDEVGYFYRKEIGAEPSKFQDDFRELIKDGSLKIAANINEEFPYCRLKIFNKKDELVGFVTFVSQRKKLQERKDTIANNSHTLRTSSVTDYSAPILFVCGKVMLFIPEKNNDNKLKEFLDQYMSKSTMSEFTADMENMRRGPDTFETMEAIRTREQRVDEMKELVKQYEKVAGAQQVIQAKMQQQRQNQQ